jgi:hypothetical protein
MTPGTFVSAANQNRRRSGSPCDAYQRQSLTIQTHAKSAQRADFARLLKPLIAAKSTRRQQPGACCQAIMASPSAVAATQLSTKTTAPALRVALTCHHITRPDNTQKHIVNANASANRTQNHLPLTSPG